MGGGLRAEGAGEPVLDVVGDVVLAAEDDDLVRGEGVADRVRGLGGMSPETCTPSIRAPMFSPSRVTVMPPAT